MNINISSYSVNGSQMDYFSFGTGAKPFVMLPGIYTKSITTLAQAVAGAYEDFSEIFTVYAFDRLSQIPKDYSVEKMAADTAAVLDGLGVKKACVFGVSMGGMIAQSLAVQRPDLVDKLVLSSTTSRLTQETLTTFDDVLRFAESGDFDSLSESFAKAVYTPTFFEQFREPILASLKGSSREDLERFAATTRSLRGFDIYDELGKIDCPTLVIGAGEDKLLGVQASKDIAEKIGAELYIYEGYGHAVYDEAPDYKERLKDFFTRDAVVIKPGKYRHFKGNMYQVLGVAKHSETLEEMVVYRALYGEGELWVRPAGMWNETVERDGKVFPRFEYVGE